MTVPLEDRRATELSANWSSRHEDLSSQGSDFGVSQLDHHDSDITTLADSTASVSALGKLCINSLHEPLEDSCMSLQLLLCLLQLVQAMLHKEGLCLTGEELLEQLRNDNRPPLSSSLGSGLSSSML